MSAIAIIPARFAAQRFPGKPLASLLGKPMVEHVYNRCLEAGCFSQVVVATDDERIAAAVRGFGGTVAMTSPTCASGTDRVAEAAQHLGLEASAIVVNVQGDEPAVHPEALATLVKLFDAPATSMATLVRPLAEAERANPNVVKAVLDESGHALYFSRADLPFARDASVPVKRWAHVGLYGFQAETLRFVASLPPTLVERTESLEQLRALAHGVRIRCGITQHVASAVDRPEDLAAAEAALLKLPRVPTP